MGASIARHLPQASLARHSPRVRMRLLSQSRSQWLHLVVPLVLAQVSLRGLKQFTLPDLALASPSLLHERPPQFCLEAG